MVQQHKWKQTESQGGDDQAGSHTDADSAPSGPVREGGGATGEGNLSPGQASRTGGATSGVGTDAQRPARAGKIAPDPGA